MMSRILKFTISPDSPTMIHLPRSSRVIMVAEQNTLVRFWVETPQVDSKGIERGSTTFVDDLVRKWMGEEHRVVRRTFELVPTGAIIDPTFMQHRGTAICAGGELVWHLYERISQSQPTQQPPTGDPTP